MKIRAVVVLWAFLLGVTVNAGAVTDEVVLLRALFGYRIADTVAEQGEQLAAKSDTDAGKQIGAAVREWKTGALRAVRSDLERQFGSRAREAFQQFWTDFSQAEKSGDIAFLERLATAAQLDPRPTTYGDLAQQVTGRFLTVEMQQAADFLSKIETWLAVQAKRERVPPLEFWLAGARPDAATEEAGTRPGPSSRPRNPLKEAEAPAGDFVSEPQKEDTGLAAFSAARAERRSRTLEEAQAGMQQVAAERQAAEQELAAVKTAAAQAEAEAMRKHAERLAAVEQEALEQRKNSWSGRLKQIVSSTLGAASGAFFGGVGSRAGEAAANAVFKE